MLKAINKDMDERERWMGLRNMKKGYQPQPYHRTEKGTGEHIHMKERAQKAAEYLRDKQWGETKERKEEKRKHIWKRSKIRNT